METFSQLLVAVIPGGMTLISVILQGVYLRRSPFRSTQQPHYSVWTLILLKRHHDHILTRRPHARLSLLYGDWA